MPHFCGLLFTLFFLKRCLATSLTLRQLPKSNSSVKYTLPSNLTSQPLSLSPDEWECAPFDVIPNLDFLDCFHAMSSMPVLSELGLFHRDKSPENIYKLPFTKTSVDCAILVNFVDDLRFEAARWSDVYHKALDIVFGCVFGHEVGGYGLVGVSKGIVVSVQYLPGVAKGDRTDA